MSDLMRGPGYVTKTLALHYYIFSPTGQVYRTFEAPDLPNGDATRFDYRAAARADPDNSGTYNPGRQYHHGTNRREPAGVHPRQDPRPEEPLYQDDYVRPPTMTVGRSRRPDRPPTVGCARGQPEGQWRGADGRPNREPTFVLEVVHPARAAGIDAAIAAIIAEYKRLFRQEAVLRVIIVGRASF